MAVAIALSFFDSPSASLRRTAVIGEIDLGGRLRSVSNLQQRLAEVAQLGCCDYCIIPKVRRWSKWGPRGGRVGRCGFVVPFMVDGAAGWCDWRCGG